MWWSCDSCQVSMRTCFLLFLIFTISFIISSRNYIRLLKILHSRHSVNSSLFYNEYASFQQNPNQQTSTLEGSEPSGPVQDIVGFGFPVVMHRNSCDWPDSPFQTRGSTRAVGGSSPKSLLAVHVDFRKSFLRKVAVALNRHSNHFWIRNWILCNFLEYKVFHHTDGFLGTKQWDLPYSNPFLKFDCTCFDLNFFPVKILKMEKWLQKQKMLTFANSQSSRRGMRGSMWIRSSAIVFAGVG